MVTALAGGAEFGTSAGAGASPVEPAATISLPPKYPLIVFPL
jgi:hypothetical protein